MRFATALICMGALIAPATAPGQTATGRLAGVVLDATGASIPRAAVSVTSEATGATVEALTNVAGAFNVSSLAPGLYTIEVSADGFRTHTVNRQKVDVALATSLPPITLELGPAAEVVVVEGDIARVQTSNAEVTSIVTAEQIQELPLIGRDPLTFVSLQAGVAYGGATSTVINGQRTSYSNVTLDGINIQDNFLRGNALDFLASRTLIDQVAEFSVTTQNGSPAVGMGSSQVNFTTQSGGPEVHGNAYWHNRNDRLAASPWFSNRQGLDKPELNFTQFGGSLGGPVVKNRVFYFANFEMLADRRESLRNTTILTPSAAQGIFRYIDLDGALREVDVFQLQGLEMDPAAAQILGQIPDPGQINNFDRGDSTSERQLNTAGHRFLTRDNGDRLAVTARGDWNATNSGALALTYKLSRESNDRPDAGLGYQDVPPVTDHVESQFLSAAWRSTFGPRWTNEARFGFHLLPGDFRNREAPTDYEVSGMLYTNPVVNFAPQGRYTDTFNIRDNAMALIGRHSLQFGFDAQLVRTESFDYFGVVPEMTLGLGVQSQYQIPGSAFPGGIDGGDLANAQSLLASLGGIISSATQTFNVRDRSSGFVPGQDNRRRYSYDSFAFYGQDNLKIGPRLTANLGLRWEYFGRMDERDSLMLLPVPGPGPLIDTLLSDAELDFAGGGVGRPLWNRDRNNFAPNIGIAWDVFGDGKTALRAGYSINYVNDETIASARNAVTANDGLQGLNQLQNLDAFLGDGPVTIDPPEYAVPRNVSQNQAIDPNTAVFSIDPNYRSPYIQQWNFGLQHEVGWKTVLEARYVGNKGTKLVRAFDYNQVIIRENGFLDDVIRARDNGFLALDASGAFDPRHNPEIAGSQELEVFPRLVGGGFLHVPIVQNFVRQGEAGGLAELYIVNGIAEGTDVSFRPNQNVLVADLVTNYSNSSYHGLQLEVRRRAARGVQFQANYTFSKVLTDASGDSEHRFDPFLDLAQPHLERARATFDLTHVFNANVIWNLPFRSTNRLLEGWTVSSIVTLQTGSPISVLSERGTLNRRARSRQNTASTELNRSQLDRVVNFRMTDDGPFMIAASAINPRDNSGVAIDGAEMFAGQSFTHPGAGQAGTLQRRLFSGPRAFVFDAALSKLTRINERHAIKAGLRVENVFNTPSFFSDDHVIGSTQFGRITSTIVGPRRIEIYVRYQF